MQASLSGTKKKSLQGIPGLDYGTQKSKLTLNELLTSSLPHKHIRDKISKPLLEASDDAARFSQTINSMTNQMYQTSYPPPDNHKIHKDTLPEFQTYLIARRLALEAKN